MLMVDSQRHLGTGKKGEGKKLANSVLGLVVQCVSLSGLVHSLVLEHTAALSKSKSKEQCMQRRGE